MEEWRSDGTAHAAPPDENWPVLHCSVPTRAGCQNHLCCTPPLAIRAFPLSHIKNPSLQVKLLVDVLLTWIK